MHQRLISTRRPVPPYPLIRIALLWLVCIFFAAQVEAQDSSEPRIVAVADVHGAYQELVGILQQTGIVDQELHWSGGSDYLISLGDIIDRGADSRDVMNLLMRLQTEAAEAGGKAIVLLGNHEAMNIVGELNYVSDPEIAAFASDETEALRNTWFEAFRRNPDQKILDETTSRDAFDAAFKARLLCETRGVLAGGSIWKLAAATPDRHDGKRNSFCARRTCACHGRIASGQPEFST